MHRVGVLLGYGADVNHRDHGLAALHYAARSGKLELIELLLKNGADPNAEDANGRTALQHLSKSRAKMDATTVRKLLVKYGAR